MSFETSSSSYTNSILTTASKNEVESLDVDTNVIVYMFNDEKDLNEEQIKESCVFRELTLKQAFVSKLINIIYTQSDTKLIPIPKNSMSVTTFNNIMDYLILNNGDETYKSPEPITVAYKKFWDNDKDTTFIEKFDKTELCNIIKASNYIDCQKLLFLSTSFLAFNVKSNPKILNTLLQIKID